MSQTSWFKRLSIMTGRLALLSDAEAVLLAKYTAIAGDHIDIGTLWGGTAILAALAKRDAGKIGMTYTIDPMIGGWWDSEDPAVKLRPTNEIVQENFDRFHLHDSIKLIKKPASPWPLPSKVKPTSILIDGDHRYEAVATDWTNASRIATKYIIFHDYGSANHPGVQKIVDDIVRHDPLWREVKQDDSLIVFERVKNKP